MFRPTYYLPACIASFRNRLSSRIRSTIAIVLQISIIVAYYFLLVPNRGGNSQPPAFVTCNKVISWKANVTCGINAQDCNPLESSWTSFRCPSSCLNSGSMLTPVGSGPYRGDSGICLAAIHSGVIAAHSGGCFYLRRSGWTDFFTGTTMNGIRSVGFEAPYPLTFELRPDPDSRFCYDFSFSVILPLTLFVIGMMVVLDVSETNVWIALICNAALYTAGPISATLSTFEIAAKLQQSLIAFGAFIWILWEHGGKQLFVGISDAPVKLIAFYIAPFFLFLHMDFTRVLNRDFDIILSTRFAFGGSIGSVLLAVIIVLTLCVCIGYSMYLLYRSNELKRIAVRYLAVLLPLSVLVILIGIAISGSFHLHHYMIPLLLWGLISAAAITPNPRLMVIQSALLAIFVNGAIAWGFDPIFDVVSSDDNDYGSWMPEIVLRSLQQGPTNWTDIEARWKADDQATNVVYSLQFNLIEIFRGMGSAHVMMNVSADSKYIHEVCVSQVWSGTLFPCIGRVRFQFLTNSTATSLVIL